MQLNRSFLTSKPFLAGLFLLNGVLQLLLGNRGLALAGFAIGAGFLIQIARLRRKKDPAGK